MKQVSIQIPFDDEKLEALKIFLSQKDQTAEAVIGELVDGEKGVEIVSDNGEVIS